MIQEGKARIEQGQGFYNPDAKTARDFGVMAGKVLRDERQRPVDVADLFAGTGIRSIRYALEVGVSRLLVNEGNHNLLPLIEENLRANSVNARVSAKEVIRLLAEIKVEERRFDLVDMDVFGSPAPFIDCVFGAVKFGGLVYFTSTDTRTACGRHPRASIRNYGTFLPRCDFCHELGARAVISVFAMAGARKGFISWPVFTLWDGRALRICMRVIRGRAGFPVENLGYILMRKDGEVQALGMGDGVDAAGHITGPVWTGPLHDAGFLAKMKEHCQAGSKIDRRISLMMEENLEPAWFFKTDTASKTVSCSTPGVEDVVARLRKKGFQAAKTQFSPTGVRTTASYSEFVNTVKELGGRGV